MAQALWLRCKRASLRAKPGDSTSGRQDWTRNALLPRRTRAWVLMAACSDFGVAAAVMEGGRERVTESSKSVIQQRRDRYAPM
jgi:hypothetical protein